MRRKAGGPLCKCKSVHAMMLNIHENLRLTGGKKQTKKERVGMEADDQRETLPDPQSDSRRRESEEERQRGFHFHLARTQICIFVCLFCFANAFEGRKEKT